LNVNPEKRYTIDEIRKHPWMALNGFNKKKNKGIVVGCNKITIDNKILNCLSDLNVEVDKTIKQL